MIFLKDLKLDLNLVIQHVSIQGDNLLERKSMKHHHHESRFTQCHTYLNVCRQVGYQQMEIYDLIGENVVGMLLSGDVLHLEALIITRRILNSQDDVLVDNLSCLS